MRLPHQQLLLLWLLGLAAGVPPPSPQGGSVSPDGTGAEGWQFMASYPRQYVTYKLQPGERIAVDGRLDEGAWAAVNWTEPMEDIAQSFYPGLAIPVPTPRRGRGATAPATPTFPRDPPSPPLAPPTGPNRRPRRGVGP